MAVFIPCTFALCYIFLSVYGTNYRNRHADETFEVTFDPANYSYNYGDAHFIILDDMVYPTKAETSWQRTGIKKAYVHFTFDLKIKLSSLCQLPTANTTISV